MILAQGIVGKFGRYLGNLAIMASRSMNETIHLSCWRLSWVTGNIWAFVVINSCWGVYWEVLTWLYMHCFCVYFYTSGVIWHSCPSCRRHIYRLSAFPQESTLTAIKFILSVYMIIKKLAIILWLTLRWFKGEIAKFDIFCCSFEIWSHQVSGCTF